ncbi:MAG TPA: ankyrin repeat domain-containing protein [Acidobacteriota bacterium]|nr:ankyrin repeat domain-containing protein [Acidobacteriota bacterium]HNT17215.1 ankyrin repeat domain-containing protein [Acidobacteriota bacterium]
MKYLFFYVFLAIIPITSNGNQPDLWSKKELRKYFNDDKIINLVSAASTGNIKAIEKLIAQGVDVNFMGKENVTPLYAMLPSLNLAGFQCLLEHGANPNIPVSSGDSVIWWLTAADMPGEPIEMLKLSLKYGGNPNWAFHNNPNSETIRVNEGEPLIISAVKSKYSVDKIKILLDAGANINAKDKNGFTALHCCVPQKYDVALFLLKAGADYMVKNNYGNSFINNMEEFPVCSFEGDSGLLAQKQWRNKVIDFIKEKGIEVHLKYPD